MKNIRKNFQKAFTLVELLVVIGILAILTAVVLVAVNPARQLAQSRNTARRAAVNSILGAITELTADDGSIDLEAIIVPDYIADMPEDPQDTSPGADTGYKVCQDATGIRYT